MAGATVPLVDLRVGDEKTVIIATHVRDTGEPKALVSCTFLVYDPDRPLGGTAEGGSSTTLIDAALTEYAEDFFLGLTLHVTDATDDRSYPTLITDFDSATGTLTFYALPIEVRAGDSYRIEGYPLLPQTAGTVSGHQGSIQLTPHTVTGRPGRRVLVYRADFGLDAESVVGTFAVVPS